jgi:hypothetical protein
MLKFSAFTKLTRGNNISSSVLNDSLFEESLYDRQTNINFNDISYIGKSTDKKLFAVQKNSSGRSDIQKTGPNSVKVRVEPLKIRDVYVQYIEVELGKTYKIVLGGEDVIRTFSVVVLNTPDTIYGGTLEYQNFTGEESKTIKNFDLNNDVYRAENNNVKKLIPTYKKKLEGILANKSFEGATESEIFNDAEKNGFERSQIQGDLDKYPSRNLHKDDPRASAGQQELVYFSSTSELDDYEKYYGEEIIERPYKEPLKDSPAELKDPYMEAPQTFPPTEVPKKRGRPKAIKPSIEPPLEPAQEITTPPISQPSSFSKFYTPEELELVKSWKQKQENRGIKDVTPEESAAAKKLAGLIKDNIIPNPFSGASTPASPVSSMPVMSPEPMEDEPEEIDIPEPQQLPLDLPTKKGKGRGKIKRPYIEPVKEEPETEFTAPEPEFEDQEKMGDIKDTILEKTRQSGENGVTIEDIMTFTGESNPSIILDVLEEIEDSDVSFYKVKINENDSRKTEETEHVFFTSKKDAKKYITGENKYLKGILVPEASSKQNLKIKEFIEKIEAYELGAKASKTPGIRSYKKDSDFKDLIGRAKVVSQDDLEENWEQGFNNIETTLPALKISAAATLLKASGPSGKTLKELCEFSKLSETDMKKVFLKAPSFENLEETKMKKNDYRNTGDSSPMLYFISDEAKEYYENGYHHYKLSESVNYKKINRIDEIIKRKNFY